MPSPASGLVTAVAADRIGIAALMLGAGRRRKEDEVDPGVGIEIARRAGDRVSAGEPLVYLVHNDRGIEDAAERVLQAYSIGGSSPEDSTEETSRVLEVMR